MEQIVAGLAQLFIDAAASVYLLPMLVVGLLGPALASAALSGADIGCGRGLRGGAAIFGYLIAMRSARCETPLAISPDGTVTAYFPQITRMIFPELALLRLR